jgi:nucleotide-binding universal stress UspA family protein
MTETSRNTKVLVGVDGSSSSIYALRHGARLAAALGVPLTAVMVWDYPALVEYSPIVDWSPEDDARTILAEAIEEAFDGAPPQDLDTSVVQGPPARALIEQSKEAGMLVVGSRGHGGFVGMLLGSVSAACAQHAQCPVLIVRSPRVPSVDAAGAKTELQEQER